MGKLVMFVTVVAFVSAAVIALINHLVMDGSTTFDEEKVRKLMKNWGPSGILVLTTLQCGFYLGEIH